VLLSSLEYRDCDIREGSGEVADCDFHTVDTCALMTFEAELQSINEAEDDAAIWFEEYKATAAIAK